MLSGPSVQIFYRSFVLLFDFLIFASSASLAETNRDYDRKQPHQE